MLTYLSLGSNLGQRLRNLKEASKYLSQYGVVVKSSSVYETEPVGVFSQPMFLNCVLAFEFPFDSPFKLLEYIHKIETSLGRKAGKRFGPRTIDIDILTFGDLRIEHPDLIVPHPRMKERLFVLEPLKEIAPSLIYPRTKISVTDLCERLYGSNYYCRKYAGPIC